MPTATAATTPAAPAPSLRVYRGPGAARNDMVEANLDVVVNQVARFAPAGGSEPDLYQDGVVALLAAVEEWLDDPAIADRYRARVFLTLRVKRAVEASFYGALYGTVAGVVTVPRSARHDGESAPGRAGSVRPAEIESDEEEPTADARDEAERLLSRLDGQYGLRDAVVRTFGLDGGGERTTREVAAEMRVSHTLVAGWLKLALVIMREES